LRKNGIFLEFFSKFFRPSPVFASIWVVWAKCEDFGGEMQSVAGTLGNRTRGSFLRIFRLFFGELHQSILVNVPEKTGNREQDTKVEQLH